LGNIPSIANIIPIGTAITIRIANIINKDGKALLKWKFEYANGGTRPTGVVYEVFQRGQRVLRGKFNN